MNTLTATTAAAGFVRDRLQLPPGIPSRPGIVAARDLVVLQRADALARRRLDDAQAQARACLAQAQADADALRERAEHDGRLRLAQLQFDLQAAWVEARAGIESAALAVARVALEQLCAQATWQEKVDAAVALAMRQLPASAVRIWLPPGAATAGAGAGLPESVRCEVSQGLATHSAAADDGSVSAVADFDLARAEVDRALLRWLQQAVAAATAGVAPPTVPSGAET